MATVILKVTEKCNSNCVYCDVVRKENSGKTMPLTVFDALLVRVDEYLRANPAERVEIVWHGGEPLLVGADYLRSVNDLIERRCSKVRDRIHHSIQTNLTLFREELVSPLRALGITALGTSYDPEPNVRGPGLQVDSTWYNERFMHALPLLARSGFALGMIYVVTRKSLTDPLAVFTYLTNLCGAVNFNPVLIYDEERKHVAITAEQYVDFLGAIFPTWWRTRHRYPAVQPFFSLVETVVNGRRNLGCVDAGDCSYGHVNVAPDGSTSQCGRSADWGLLPYGNIGDRTLDEILHDVQRDELAARQASLRGGECKECRFWELCHGGCPLDAWSKHKSFGHKTEWCDARRLFLTRYFEPITGISYTPREES